MEGEASMRRFKKLLSLVLSAALLLGCLETSVFAATADFTFDVTKIEKYSEETHDVLADEVTSVKEGDIIVVTLSFSNHTTSIKKIGAYAACLLYDGNIFTPYTDESDTKGAGLFWEGPLADVGGSNFIGSVAVSGMVTISGGTASGVTVRAGQSAEFGKIAFKVSKNLRATEAVFKFDAAYADNELADSVTNPLDFGMGDEQSVTVYGQPYLTASAKADAKFYDTTTLEQLKAGLAVQRIDEAGKATDVTDFTVSVTDWKTGENTVTVTAGGLSTTVTVTAVADTVEFIEKGSQPTKGLVYTSGETLDLSGMTIKVYYASGIEKIVGINDNGCTTEPENSTTLTVNLHNTKKITVTYEKKMVETWALTVNPRPVTVPTAEGTYTYTGEEQTFTIGKAGDKAYYTITGSLTGTEAGTYTATASLKDKTETQWNDDERSTYDKTLTWKIQPNANALTLERKDNSAITYNGQEQEPEYIVKSGNTELTAGTDYTLSYSNNTNAGTATVTATGLDNYAGATGSAEFTIAKAAVALTWSGADTRTYDGKASNVTASVTNKIGNDDVTVTVTGGDAVNAGTYTAAVAGLAGAKAGNYQLPEEGLTQSYTINRAALTIASVAVEGKTYDGTTDAKVTSVTFNGLQNGEELVSGTDYTVAGVFDEADVGERTVTVTVTMRDTAKAKNYQLEKTTATATTTITPVQTTLELTAKDAVYTGSAYDAKNISKVSNVNDAPVYTYYADNNSEKGAKLDGAPVNAGTYWVEGYIAASGNNSAVTSDAVQFQITKAPLTATAENKSATYGDTAPAYTVRYAGFVNNETESVVTGLITFDCAYAAGSDAGEYAITPKGATADNYAITFVEGKLTVGKLTAALAWNDYAERTYDGKASNVTASVTNKIGNDDVTVTVTGGTAVNAGTYIATATGLAGDKAKNYQLPETGLSQEYTINRAALTIASVAVEGKTYDGTTDAKVTSVTFNGLQNGEELVSGTDYTVAGVFAEADVGERTVTVTVTMKDTAKAKNYQLEKTTATATATITPVQTTLSLTAKDAVYTGSAYDAETKLTASSNVENPTITYTYYADNNGEKGAKLDGAPVNAGTYWVEGYIAASGNNSEVTSDAVQFQITQAPLTATAENMSATYGDTAPAYTVRYAGFVNNETESVVTGLITFDCAYAAGSDAGEYAITPKGATADNYAITFVEGKLTVGKRTAALEWSGYAERTYDGKASSVTASVTNKIGNDDVTVTVTGGDAVNAGTYTAAATGLAGAKAGNYQLPETGLTQSYTIGKAARTLSGLADLTLAGDTLSAALQPKVNDLDQSALFTYESSNTAAVTVNAQGVVSAVANGTATVTVTVPATANYEAAEASVTVKAVTQAITAVSAAPDTVSAALQGKTIVLSGYAESITVTPAYYDGVRLKSGSLTVKAGETAGIVLTVDGRDIPWTIDASAVVVKPANVTVATDDEVAKAPDADETITDEVLNAIAGGNTTASGLDQAAAGLIPEAAKNAPEGTAAVELTFVTQILPESYQNGVLVLEIRPVAQYKYLDQQGNAIKTEEKAIANSDIQGLVTLSVQLPAGMPVADLYARHDLGGGQYEYLPVTVENGAATWQQGSFSRVSLIADARSAAVTFRMPDGSEQTVTYTPENIGQSLPAASRAGYRFDGWKFPGIDGTYKTLTDELLTALNGKTLTAEAQFTVMGGGGGGGGFVSAGYAVSIAKTENGTVTASAETAEEGETITLTVKAETGYVLKTLTAAAEGKDLTLTAGKNGTYTFTMPAADVTVTAVFEKISFADVKSGSYCYDAVQWAVAKGITLGMSDGSFAPNAPCTRGQIVTFLWRAMGCPAPKSTVNPFTDVKSGSYCYEAVLWAVEQGITKGTTATTFSPNETCTRGQAVTFLCRAVGTEGTGDTGFADVGANSFCAGSVKWAVENGVTKGTTATTFSPNETCTRGQIVTFLYRAMGK